MLKLCKKKFKYFADTAEVCPGHGSGCHVYVTNHSFANPYLPIIDQGHDPSEAVVIGKGAWLGANVIILPGVNIGANAVVAAGAVVTKSIPAGVLVGGVPAKIIK